MANVRADGTPCWWTTSEDRILRHVYPLEGLQAAVAVLPGRTPRAIRQRALSLGLKAPRLSRAGLPRVRWHDTPELDAVLREQIPLLADRLNRNVAPWLAQFGVNVSLDIAGIKAFVLKYLDANLEDGLAAALSSARIGGSIALALIGNLVLVPVVLFYLLEDWPRLVERARALIPPRMRERVGGFLDECDAVLGQYLRGQLLVMLILAAFYSIALALFGFDLALPVGVFTGLAIFIPYLGYGLGLVLALLAGVLQFASWYGLVAVAVVYGVGQLVESLWLTPAPPPATEPALRVSGSLGSSTIPLARRSESTVSRTLASVGASSPSVAVADSQIARTLCRPSIKPIR